MRSTIRIAIWELKLTTRHIGFWLALIYLNVFDFYTSYSSLNISKFPSTSWDTALWLSRIPHIYLMVGFIALIIMGREYTEGYDGILHAQPYSKHHFILGRYLALVFIGCFFVWQQHLVHIIFQYFFWQTPIHFGVYLSFFLVRTLPAVAFFSALCLLVATLTNRYRGVGITFVLLLWWLALIKARDFIINSEKLYGSLPDLLGGAMFASMDPVLRWFPELELILLNRLVYCCLTFIILIMMFLLFRRRNETKTRPVVFFSFIPLGVVVALAVSSYLNDWNLYLERVQAIEIVISPSNISHGVIKSNPAVLAEQQFESLDYTLTIQLDEANRQMQVHSLIKIVDPLELSRSGINFALDSDFAITKLTDEQGNPLNYTWNGDQLVVYPDNNQNITSFTLRIDYGGEVWQWEKIEVDSLRILMQFVNTGWLSQYITDQAVWMSPIYAWYPQLQLGGSEHRARYKITVLSEYGKVFISNTGHLLPVGTESGFYRYELDMADTAALMLGSAPFIHIEHGRFKIYCLEENKRFAHNLIRYLEDKVNFYEMVTNQDRQTPFVVVQSNGNSGVAPHIPLVLRYEEFSSYIGETYPYQKPGIKPVDLKLAFDYLAHPIDGLSGLSSSALGIGSYIDSLYIKQLGFDSVYAQERELRLAIAEAAINKQFGEKEALTNRIKQEFDPIQISWLPFTDSSNEIWLELDQIYSKSGFEVLCEVIQEEISKLRMQPQTD